jgi:hypothetical protein
MLVGCHEGNSAAAACPTACDLMSEAQEEISLRVLKCTLYHVPFVVYQMNVEDVTLSLDTELLYAAQL